MKFGRIYSYKDAEDARKLIGKEVIFSDLYKVIDDDDFTDPIIQHLAQVDSNSAYPFTNEFKNSYQFIREVIEEEPEYRPFTPDELKRQVGQVVINKMTGDWSMVTVFDNKHSHIGIARSIVFWTAKEFLDSWTFSDGTPCGVEEN